jgi:uncharacterized protein
VNFFVKLIPRRSTFPQGMTDDERVIMLQHRDYWTDLMHKKMVIVFGPVTDPAGVFGMGVIEVEDEAAARNLLDGDPAIVLNRYELQPMRAVHPGLSSEQRNVRMGSKVYLLWFVTENDDASEDNGLLIGAYENELDAEGAIERLKTKQGFATNPSGFQIHARELGQDSWTEGFVRD